jgi:hypothetical protein
MKITRFKIKGRNKKVYQGICLHLGWLKLERIGFGNKWMYRLEFSNWNK